MDENENINGFADEPMVDDEPEKVSEPAATDESENRYAEPIALSAEELKKAYKEQTERAKVVKRAEKKVQPNDPCPCGSGRKYKMCCGRNA